MKTFWLFTCGFYPIYPSFLWFKFLQNFSSSIVFFPCLDFFFFLYVKKCLPLISGSDFRFLVVILRCTSSVVMKFALSPPQAGVSSQTWVDWRVSSDGDLSADPDRQVARDITPLAPACSGRVFFQSLQIGEWRFYQGSSSALSIAQS